MVITAAGQTAAQLENGVPGSAGRHLTPTRRTPPSTSSALRTSPYPLRQRTPPQSSSPHSRRPARVSLSTSPCNQEPSHQERHRLQLVVQGIVKDTVGMRDSFGRVLDIFAANGANFGDIMHKLWEQFGSHVDGLAVKEGNAWSRANKSEAAWNKVMQFKANGRIVSTTKSGDAWDRWVASQTGETVILMIYTYGLAITNARVLLEFRAQCILPEHTDRSGAAEEVSIREVVLRLREIWGTTFQASTTVWRMWANEITSNLDRSTWEVKSLDPPTTRIMAILRPADVQIEQHLSSLSKSVNVALDIVNASIADNEELLHHWEVFGMRIANQKNALAARKDSLEGIRDAIPLPPLSSLLNPLDTMENIEDIEHQE